tara:strand:+ start:2778 stop:2969 length:192 start_codon:yes stop_codon:yes gene_type:complete
VLCDGRDGLGIVFERKRGARKRPKEKGTVIFILSFINFNIILYTLLSSSLGGPPFGPREREGK